MNGRLENRIRQAAYDSVYRETESSIVTPRYTREALEQMGWARSKGMRKAEREIFADHFAMLWLARYKMIVAEQQKHAPVVKGKTFKTIT